MRGSLLVVGLFFFKQKTAYELRISDWSSDVCSSDLLRRDVPVPAAGPSWSAAFLLRDGGVLCRRSVRGLRKQRRPRRGEPIAAADVSPCHDTASAHVRPSLMTRPHVSRVPSFPRTNTTVEVPQPHRAYTPHRSTKAISSQKQ